MHDQRIIQPQIKDAISIRKFLYLAANVSKEHILTIFAIRCRLAPSSSTSICRSSTVDHIDHRASPVTAAYMPSYTAINIILSISLYDLALCLLFSLNHNTIRLCHAWSDCRRNFSSIASYVLIRLYRLSLDSLHWLFLPHSL